MSLIHYLHKHKLGLSWNRRSSANNDVIEIMRDGANSTGVAAAIFEDCYYAAK